jgi:hypothetical protein
MQDGIWQSELSRYTYFILVHDNMPVCYIFI